MMGGRLEGWEPFYNLLEVDQIIAQKGARRIG